MDEKLKPFSEVNCYSGNITTMGFIRNALMGIALYEAVKYFLRNEDHSFDFASEGTQGVSPSRQQVRDEDVDVIAGARQTDHLKRMEENASSGGISPNVSSGLLSEPSLSNQDSGDDLAVGTNPETPLTGEDPDKASNDPWKKSLANDELRAPDS